MREDWRSLADMRLSKQAKAEPSRVDGLTSCTAVARDTVQDP